MGVTTSNLLLGPAVMWSGIFGATEPVIGAVPSTGWTDVGATNGGLELGFDDTYTEFDIDQVNMTPESRRSKRKVSAKTNLAESTVANLALALNNSAPSSGILTPDDGQASLAPGYNALILDGYSPGGFKRRVILRKVLQTGSVGTSFKKDGVTMFPVEFTVHWISSSIRPWIWTDAAS